ncbi:MAG: hypothetical protein Q7S28_01045 [bacterium]|nr:hypothetical protein [bacterium]
MTAFLARLHRVLADLILKGEKQFPVGSSEFREVFEEEVRNLGLENKEIYIAPLPGGATPCGSHAFTSWDGSSYISGYRTDVLQNRRMIRHELLHIYAGHCHNKAPRCSSKILLFVPLALYRIKTRFVYEVEANLYAVFGLR